jgi:hypothetical protein
MERLTDPRTYTTRQPFTSAAAGRARAAKLLPHLLPSPPSTTTSNGEEGKASDTPTPELVSLLSDWPSSTMIAQSSLYDGYKREGMFNGAMRSTTTVKDSVGPKGARAARLLKKMRTERSDTAAATSSTMDQSEDTLTSTESKSSTETATSSSSAEPIVEPSVMLIQRPSQLGRGLGAGYSMIVPSGWAMAWWKALVYAGARVIGLRDRRRLMSEIGDCSFPEQYPDTPAGHIYESFTGSQAR